MIDYSSIYDSYRSRTVNPIRKKTLRQAVSPYKLTLASAKGKTDSEIRRMAARAVIKRYRRRKAKTGTPYNYGNEQPTGITPL